MTDHHDAVLKLISSTSAGNLTIFHYLVPGEISLHANCNIFELYHETGAHYAVFYLPWNTKKKQT